MARAGPLSPSGDPLPGAAAPRTSPSAGTRWARRSAAPIRRRGRTGMDYPDERASGRRVDSRSSCEAVARIVHELRILAAEREPDGVDRPVAVLGDDDVGLARSLGIVVVVLVSVDEADDVGILLDRARVTKVREDGTLVPAALFNVSAELRQRDHGDAQLAREALQSTRYLAHLLDAALDAAFVAHELEVVDDDQPEAALVLELVMQAPGLRPHLEHAGVTGVVDVQRRPGQPAAGLDYLRPLGLGNAAAAQVVALDLRLRGEKPLRELRFGHL